MNSINIHGIARTLFATRVRARALATGVLAAALMAACDVHEAAAPGTLASITVLPNITVRPTATQQMFVIGRDADGRVVDVSPTWAVAAGGGTIDSEGVFTAGTAAGVFPSTVVATAGTVTGRTSITVIPGALASVAVAPAPVTLAASTTQPFAAVATDAWGNVVEFTPTWSVIAGGGAIEQNGVFTASPAVGLYVNTVQASNNGVRGFATVNVTAAGALRRASR